MYTSFNMFQKSAWWKAHSVETCEVPEKVKITLEQATKAQRENRSVALLFL
jgi:hypothetical protein